MIGQSVLRECLHDRGVQRVVTVGRRPTGRHHAKLTELVRPDLATLAAFEAVQSSVHVSTWRRDSAAWNSIVDTVVQRDVRSDQAALPDRAPARTYDDYHDRTTGTRDAFRRAERICKTRPGDGRHQSPLTTPGTGPGT